jgi:acetyl-CoA C-acetyltransferase
MKPDRRAAVLVGVGVAQGDSGEEAVALMTRATKAAGADTGAKELLRQIDRIAVPRGTWSYRDPARLVAQAVGADSARTHLVDVGIPQQTLINEGLRAIAAGESEVTLVVGGEAKRRDHLAQQRGTTATETDQGDARPDGRQSPEGEFVAPVELEAGIVNPVEQYALIDNALRAEEGRSLAEHRAEIAALWSRFNAVARSNPDAAFPTPMTAAEIDTPGPANRPLAFPYNKWHASQWNVDQAAAVLLCSVDAARKHGVAPERMVFPRVALDSSHAVSLSRRRHLHRWPAMEVLGRAAAEHVGRPLADAETIEVYSCFPAAVRVQQRELGLPLDGAPTVTGGMTFAGGPLNNFVFQATAAVIEQLRATPGSMGVVTTVSGLLTKPGLAVWSADPGDEPLLVADLAEPVAHATETVDTVAGYEGPATVATYTVTYDGLTPARVVVIADTPDDERCVAVSVDETLAAQAVDHELIGAAIRVRDGSFTTGG